MQKKDIEDLYPLSPLQEGMLFHSLYDHNSETYFAQFHFDLDGEVNVKKFKKAFEVMIKRHSIFRTGFLYHKVEKPLQIVFKSVKTPLYHYDWRQNESSNFDKAFEVFLNNDRQQGFTFEQAPLIRCSLIRVSDDKFCFVFSFHHLILDGWSTPIFFNELFEIYRAYCMGNEPNLVRVPPFKSYIAWLMGQDKTAAEEFWRGNLKGIESPTIIGGVKYSGKFHDHQREFDEQIDFLPENVTQNLKIFVKEHNITSNILLQGAWSLLLSRYSGDEDVIFGTINSGRQADLEGIETMVGLLISSLPLRVNTSGENTVGTWLKKLHEQNIEVNQYSYCSLTDIQRWSAVPQNMPLFESLFVFQNYSSGTGGFKSGGDEKTSGDKGSGIQNFDAFERSNYPLTIIAGQGKEMPIKISYDCLRFDSITISRMIKQITNLLVEIVKDPERKLSEIPMISRDESKQLLIEWNDTEVEYVRDRKIHEIFEDQVEQTPDSVAVLYEDKELSYRELNRRSNQLAHYLRSLGIGPDVLVGIYMDRSLELIVSIIAVLKAGGAYVPLDPSYPSERLAFMLSDSCAPVVLTQKGYMKTLTENISAKVICVDTVCDNINGGNDENFPVEVTSENLAYVIYTSGSTGSPKGVMITHGGLVNYVTWASNAYDISSGQGALVHSSFSFDLTVTGFYLPLLAGRSVTLVGEDRSSEALKDALENSNDFSLIKLTPAHLEVLGQMLPPEKAAGRTRRLIIGGEALNYETLAFWKEHAPETILINEYGPTETVVGCCVYEVDTSETNTGSVPIGRPVANTQLYVLNNHFQPSPVGIPGELYIGGDCIGRGYLNRPDLTVERYIPDSFSGRNGTLLYRTGDSVSYRPDGNLEFIGRVDEQVKIRGYRIELGEIESVLTEHPDVREGVVTALDRDTGDKRLVAYIVPSDEGSYDASEIRDYLYNRLTEYMIPSAFVALEELPLTANGKVDRKSLPDPDKSGLEGEYVAPRNETEEKLVEIWSEVLDLDRIGVHDNFFEIGGNSLLATQVVSRILEVFSVNLPVRVMFESKNITELSLKIEEASMEEDSVSPIEPVSRDEDLPLSFAQERLWFLDQLIPDNPMYNSNMAIRLRQYIDISVLRRVFAEIARRHEVLRTRFGMKEGQPIQIIDQEIRGIPSIIDLQSLSENEREIEALRLAAEESLLPFDLKKDTMLRAKLAVMNHSDYVFLLTMHHIASDGWSMGILIKELMVLMTAYSKGEPSPLPDLPIQYADFAVWQRDRLSGDVMNGQLAYWKDQLSGMEPLEIPTDYTRPAIKTYKGDSQSFFIEAGLAKKLNDLSRNRDVSLYMTILSVFSILLSRYSGQEDIVVGSPIANRNRKEIENLIGFFVNTLVMRTDLSGNPSYLEVMERVRKTCLDAYANQDISLEHLVEEIQPERDMSRNPFFQILLTLQNAPNDTINGSSEIPDSTFTPIGSESRTVRFDMEVDLWETPKGIDGSVVYSTDLFKASTITQMIKHFTTLLGEIVLNPENRISEIGMLSEEELHNMLIEWNNTSVEYPHDKCIHELFEEQAEQIPDAVAIVFEGEHISYAKLNSSANSLARYLKSIGVKPDARVAISMERDIMMVVGLLAVLKAGGTYVPLDPGYPDDRLMFMLKDCNPTVLLTQKRLSDRLNGFLGSKPIIHLDDNYGLEDYSSDNLKILGLTPQNLAYVMYTSGSTGIPKGVMVEHQGVVNYCSNIIKLIELNKTDTVFQQNTLSFDLSVEEIFCSISAGATLQISKNIFSIPELKNNPSISPTTLHLTTRHWELLLEDWVKKPELISGSLQRIRLITIGGDKLSIQKKHIWNDIKPDHVQLVNTYGPTEATVACTAEYVNNFNKNVVSIGRPITNTPIYILDTQKRPVPVRAIGDIYIGGTGLARGYSDNPELTSECFIPNPFNADLETRIYKTGDLGRWLLDGTIEFIGRNDHQAKIRGYRIELGEIESVLMNHVGIQEGIVLIREDIPGKTRLVAYIVLSENQKTEIVDIRRYLKENLPDYMIPSAFIELEALPLTPNGKVDRRNLPDPEKFGFEEEYVPPRSETEAKLVEIWTELLDTDRIGVHDNFFDIGGNSLIAVQVISRLREIFSVELPVRVMFESQDIEELSLKIEEARVEGVSVSPIEPVSRDEDLPLSFAQERLWFLDQLVPDNPSYNMSDALRVKVNFNLSVIRRVFKEIVRRHEAIRTRFVTKDGKPVQIIDDDIPVLPFIIDLKHLKKSESTAEANRIAIDESLLAFNLSEDLMLRARLLLMDKEEYVMLLTMHHIASDGWSISLLHKEIIELYLAYIKGYPSPLQELPVQYADYAVWQRNWLSGEALERQLSYWRDKLTGVSPLKIPTDYSRPAVQNYRGGMQSVFIEPDITEKLAEISKKKNASLYMSLLATFSILLSRYSKQEDIAIGTPIANRNRKEIESLIGFFINTLVIRNDLSGDPSFLELLERVRDTSLDAYANQDLPFEYLLQELQPERDLSRNPIFNVFFNMINIKSEEIKIDGLEIENIPLPDTHSKFDLTVYANEQSQGVQFHLVYNGNLFTGDRIKEMIEQFKLLLSQIADDPEKAISCFSTLTDEAKAALPDPSIEIESAWEDNIHSRINRQAFLNPEQLAVVDTNEELTYGKLNNSSNQLARYLMANGIQSQDIVAIYGHRSAALVTAVIGVLKAGAAFLILDSRYPASRLVNCLTVAKPKGWIQIDSSDDLPEELEEYLADISYSCCLKISSVTKASSEDLLGEFSEDDLNIIVNPDDLAYVTFTSGTTGIPKAVAGTHRPLSHFLDWYLKNMEYNSKDRFSMLSGLSHDPLLREIFTPLWLNATLYIPNPDFIMSPSDLIEWMNRNDINVIHLTPALSHVLTGVSRMKEEGGDLKLTSLRYAVFAGDVLMKEDINRIRKLAPNAACINCYGTTETPQIMGYYKVPDEYFENDGSETERKIKENIPLGKGIQDVQLLVLDPSMQLAGIGQVGEIYIRTPYLAKGYIGDEELSKEKFIHNPFTNKSNDRLYRTGDLGRYMLDGNIEFIGRMDNQVKIRGFRIELGEIESVMSNDSLVRENVVLAMEDISGNKLLIGYVVPEIDSELIDCSIDEIQSEHISKWQQFFDNAYDNSIYTNEPDFKASGWKNSYTDEPMAEEEMQEWMDETVKRIKGLNPDSVLELGCGRGLLLSRIAPECNKYLGTDFSQNAIQYLEDLKGSCDNLSHIELLNAEAIDFNEVKNESFDTVILNSVVQYFPSVEYLLKVLDGVMAILLPGGKIFISDVGDNRLLDLYHASVQEHKASSSLTGYELKQLVNRSVSQEDKLFLEPSFFYRLKEKFSKISNVRVCLKNSKYHNEISRFHYDVIIETGDKGVAHNNIEWLNSHDNIDLNALNDILIAGNLDVIGLQDIPNTRLANEIRIMEWLDSDKSNVVRKSQFRNKIINGLDSGVDPDDLLNLGRKLNYRVELYLSETNNKNRFNAVFKHKGIETVLSLEPGPTLHDDEDPTPGYPKGYSNDPLYTKKTDRIITELRGYLQEKLPDYMIPFVFMTLKELPLTPNGKVDRKKLPLPFNTRAGIKQEYVPPSTPVEEALVGIWSEVLRVERIGIYDNFFDIGGHSLLAIIIINGIYDFFGVEIPVRTIFELHTIHALAQKIDNMYREVLGDEIDEDYHIKEAVGWN